MQRRQPCTWILGCALAVLSGRALCAPHLEPCSRRANDYEERVERLLRDAWPEQMQLLVISYDFFPRARHWSHA